jgi:phthalate 4,5-dioxygenase oxygenase subunit
LRLTTLRDLGDDQMHVRVTNQIFPHGVIIPISSDMNITQWHVPIDDENCYWYTMFTDYKTPVDKEKMRADRIVSCTLPDYRSIHSKSDGWGFDADEQRTRTYTGMGDDINFHDQWAVESLGRTQDRTKENLGQTDIGIMAYRRMLRKAITAAEQAGAVPLGGAGEASGQSPISIDTMGAADQWNTIWQEHDRARREASPWASV